jgi:hypothetical protein
MKNLITSAITLSFTVTSIAYDHKPDWAVEIGNAVAQTVWLCDLINGSTMEDVTRIDKRLHKYLDTHQLIIKRDIILPSLDTYSGYDYGALEWAT